MTRRRICVITSSRADYGLLYWLIRELAEDPGAKLQLVATGMHLSPEFGLTYRAIEEDGIPLAARVEGLLSSDSAVGIAKSMGLTTLGFAPLFEELKPDIVVVLGDRFEILAAAQAAMVARIPIAHIHGGEATEGLIDEAIRHSLTKMSQLHFAAAEPYRKRIIQLGEQPDRIFNVGAMGLDNIKRLALLDREALEDKLNFTIGHPLFVATYHPVTLDSASPSVAMSQLLKALDAFPRASIVLTQANADPQGRIINKMIDEFVAKHQGRTLAAASLGQTVYLSLIKQADCVVGNSSSGILEAPACGTPTVNIGERQCGRLRAPSVIDCAESAESIVAAIEKALDPETQAVAAQRVSPFGDGGAARHIKEILLSVPLEGILMKRFYDLDFDA
jgi:UDP-N-acetylglucosamine 2-epimerase (non-hydrolysing)/GDP/UDP-N,N'-diacetylbacillosamine 2-epimerase (hydrolysing)